jgi:hypothetical protein
VAGSANPQQDPGKCNTGLGGYANRVLRLGEGGSIFACTQRLKAERTLFPKLGRGQAEERWERFVEVRQTAVTVKQGDSVLQGIEKRRTMLAKWRGEIFSPEGLQARGGGTGGNAGAGHEKRRSALIATARVDISLQTIASTPPTGKPGKPQGGML